MGVRAKACLGVLATSLIAVAPTAASQNPGDTPARGEASNMGLCSAFLGQLQARDDVNRILKERGGLLGIDSPGELYRIRAQEHPDASAADECLQR
jgi:hypothetical protein